MATQNTNLPNNISEYPNSFKRQTSQPLEMYEVFYNLDELKNYAQNSQLAYVGQYLKYSNSTTGVVKTYCIQNANGDLVEIPDKNYVDDAISAGGGSIIIDSELSDTSTHAVQNKVIKQAIDLKQDQLTFDDTPTTDSINPVTSKGIKNYVDDAISAGGGSIVVDSELSDTSTHAVQNKVIKQAIDLKADQVELERLHYYGDKDIVPSDESYFTVDSSIGNGLRGLTDVGETQTELVIPYKINGVEITSIIGAFFSNQSLTSVIIPNSVTSIVLGAFFNCTSLISIDIPNSVTNIGNVTFGGCTSLASITIPNSVTSIGQDAFASCTSLASITIPNSVISIGDSAFSDCTSLKSIYIPNSVTNIGDGAFNNCASLTIYCEQNSYAETYANTNNIPVVYTDISKSEFDSKANKATTLKGYGITDAYTKTEVNTKLSTVYKVKGSSTIANLPTNPKIGDVYNITDSGTITDTEITVNEGDNIVYTTDGWDKLAATIDLSGYQEKLTFDTIPTTNSVNPVTSGGTKTALDLKADQVELERLHYYGDKDVIPSDESYFTVNETGETITGLTDNGKTQTEIVIPYKINGVEITSINNSALATNTSLISVNIPNSITNIGDGAFASCTSLTSVNIPNSVTNIGFGAFSNTSLISVNIPDRITSIGNVTFGGCTSLKTINIPNSVTNIANSSFMGCTNLKIYCEQGSYAETYANTNNIPVVYTDISATDFNNKADTSTTLDGYGITDASHITTSQFDASTAANAGKVGDIHINTATGRVFICSFVNPGKETLWTLLPITTNDINTDSDGYVLDVKTLKTKLSDMNESINDGLNNKLDVSSVVNDLKTDSELVPLSAAQGVVLKGLVDNKAEQVELERLNYYGDKDIVPSDESYFTVSGGNITGLSDTGKTQTELVIPYKINGIEITSIDSGVFYNCTLLTSINIPNSVISISDGAFSGCTSLMTVNIPNGIPFIASATFSGCTSLTTIHLPNSIVAISEQAFYGCTSLKSINIPNSVTSIDNNAFDNCPNLTIYCEQGSYAETYAKTNNIPVIYTDVSDMATETELERLNYYGDKDIVPSDESYFTVNETGETITGLSDTGKTQTELVIPYRINGKEITNLDSGSSASILSGNDVITKVFIPNSVINIGKSAFTFCTKLTSINIPNSVTSIGKSAFNSCASLTSINIPNSVTSIGESAFYNCQKLTSVNISNNITSIGKTAFFACYLLTSVNIPNSVTSIGDQSFAECTSLTSVNIPNSVTDIGINAFYVYDYTNKIYIPNPNLIIYCEQGSYAETYANNNDIPVIYTDVKGDIATETELKSLKYYGDKDIVPSDESYFTVNSTKETITGLTNTGKTQTELVIPYEINGVEITNLYAVNGETSILDGNNVITKVVIPNSVTSIGDTAFFSCTSLTSINIPNSVTYIGPYAFYDCTSLVSINIPNSVTSIRSYTFRGCRSLTSVNIPNSVTYIDMSAFFNCTALKSIKIPNSVTAIEFSAFYGCTALTKIEIPNSVTSIGEGAFQGCTNLTIYCEQGSYAETYANTKNIPVMYTDVKDMATETELERLKYYGDKDIVPSDESYFTVNSTKETITGLTNTGKTQTELVIPYKINGKEITTLYSGVDSGEPQSILDGSTTITKITIPKSVTTLGRGAFYDCNLRSIEIPNSVTYIGDYAFYDCTSLTSIEIPNSVTSIGMSAFRGCILLTSINIPNSVISIGNEAFYGCSSLTSISISNSVTSVGRYAFYGCTELTKIEIPNSVTSIGEAAFQGCTNLIIYCEQGSYAESYAQTNNIPVMYMDIDKATISDLKQKSIPHTTASGYPLTITDHLEGKTVINYQVYGNSTQATRSGKNILPYPYVNTTKTISGITFTDNGDGTITVSGTATANAYFTLTALTEYNSGSYYLSGCPTGGSTSTYLLSALNRDSNYTLYKTDIGSGVQISLTDSDTLKFQIRIMNGTTVNNLIFKPQLEVGTTATEYEQYGVMPSPDYPSEIQSVGDLVTDETSEYYGKYDVPVTVCGKNLFDMETILPEQGWVKQDDGSYYVANNGNVRNKVLWENTENYTGQLKILFQAKYAVDNTRGSYLWVNYTDGTYLVVYYAGTVVANTWYYPESSRTITDSNKIVQNIVWTYGTGATSTWVKDIIITKDLTATEYEQYSGETKHIYLNAPLRKVGDYADYVDFENQKVVRNVIYAKFDQTSYWTTLSGYENLIVTNISNSLIGEGYPCLSNISNFEFGKYSDSTYTGLTSWTSARATIMWREDGITVDAFKERLATTPMFIICIRATPREEAITVPELSAPISEVMNVSSSTATQPSKIDLTYYQDINKKLDEIYEDISSTNTEIENIHTNYVKFTDYATSSKAGVVKYTNSLGIAVNSEGYIYTLAANEDQINLRQSSRYSIVPSNLDYAVSKSTHQDMSEDYDTSTLTVSTSFEGNQGKLPVAYDAVKNFIDDLKYKSIPHTTVRDYPISIFDYLGGENAINYQIYGNSTQATRSGKNLIPYPYTNTTTTVNGITFQDNGDGTIILNGTVQNGAGFVICQNVPIDTSKTYFLSGIPSNITNCRLNFLSNDAIYTTSDVGNGALIDLSSYSNIKTFSMTLTVSVGDTLSNVVIKPQLEIGTEATSYEQYGVMPSPDYPSEIQSVGNLVTNETSEYYGKYDIPMIIRGKNLIKYPYQYTTRDINGIRFTDNGNGSVTINGTAAANAIWFMYLNKTNLIDGLSAGDKITLSSKSDKKWSSSKMSINCNYFNQSGTEKDGGLKLHSDSHSATNTITDEWKGMEIYIVVLKGQTIDNITISPQLEKGSSATEYEPYKDKIIKHIYLDEPLRKVGDYADYIDFKNQKVVRKIKEVAFDGTETWGFQETNNFLYTSISGTASVDYCLSTHYIDKNRREGSLMPYFRPITDSLRLYQSSDNVLYSSADDFKTFLANQNTAGNPLIVDYILTTPTEESITVPKLSVQISGSMNISINTVIKPSQIDFTYYQDINKVITNLTNAILAQGGNV